MAPGLAVPWAFHQLLHCGGLSHPKTVGSNARAVTGSDCRAKPTVILGHSRRSINDAEQSNQTFVIGPLLSLINMAKALHSLIEGDDFHVT